MIRNILTYHKWLLSSFFLFQCCLNEPFIIILGIGVMAQGIDLGVANLGKNETHLVKQLYN